MHHLLFTVCWNIGGSVFFNLKLIFNPEHIENTVNTLVNISMTTKNPRNILKKQNQSRAKMILMVRSTFSGKENEKKTKSNYSCEMKLIDT
jgi:hypothetical protein